ncbi:MAG: hypothetical protein MZV64_09755 [Ignavibacteriales bacterium]|nr:hypothetical protein [Ignavibacteriales bacterium]
MPPRLERWIHAAGSAYLREREDRFCLGNACLGFLLLISRRHSMKRFIAVVVLVVLSASLLSAQNDPSEEGKIRELIKKFSLMWTQPNGLRSQSK